MCHSFEYFIIILIREINRNHKTTPRFPTTDEFIKYMNTRMIEKVAAFTQSQSPPQPSAPSFDSLDGGKKTRRRISKKHKHFKKSRHHR
jgi:hypothetical protein